MANAPYAARVPTATGTLEVGGTDAIYWEAGGRPDGKPALVLHGGPGSGCTPWHRTLFDPDEYRVVLFDQRNCGRSTPHASEPDIDLSANTTQNLIADIELLRNHLEVERWLVWGGSWGSTLALAYAEAHPDRVTEMILWGITTGRRSEADWLFRGGVAPLFPEQWARLRRGVPDFEKTSTSSTRTPGCCSTRTRRCAAAPRTTGACGSRRPPTGHPGRA